VTVKIDMNNLEFQRDFFALEKVEQTSLIKTLKKISNMTWNEIYVDKGIRWESITNPTKFNQRIYSFRFSQKYRGLGYREGDFLRLLTLHPNHDSAYEKM
jgi:Golgi nucleoside diphosphatase